MEINAGDLRSEIALQERVGASAGGYDQDRYETYAEVYACVRDESDREYVAAEAAQVEHAVTFIIRWRSCLPRDSRILFEGNAYEVRHIDAYDHRGDYIKLRGVLVAPRATVRR